MIISEILPPCVKNTAAFIGIFNNARVGINNQTRLSFDAAEQEQHAHGEVSETWTYVNYTNKDITIKDRTGIAFKIKSTPKVTNRHFVLRRCFKMRYTGFESLVKLLQSKEVFDEPELNGLRQNLHAVRKLNAHYLEFTLEYLIPIEDLQRAGGYIYHFQTDKVLSIGDVDESPLHPYGQSNKDLTGFGRQEYFTVQRAINHRVRYVSHEDNPRPRYIKILNHVYTLYPERLAPARTMVMRTTDGVWCAKPMGEYIQLVHTSSKDNVSGIFSIIYTLEEAQKEIGVFDSYEMARSHGDIESSQKQKLAQAQYAIEQLKLETLREKEAAQQSADLRSNELAMKNHELDLFKISATREKAALEQHAIKLQSDLQELKTAQIKSEIELTNLLAEQKRIDADRKSKDEQLQREARQQDERLARMRDEHEATLKKIRDEHADQLKREAAQLKDSYEARSLARKDASESIKIIPALIMTIGTIIAFFFGKSAKSA